MYDPGAVHRGNGPGPGFSDVHFFFCLEREADLPASPVELLGSEGEHDRRCALGDLDRRGLGNRHGLLGLRHSHSDLFDDRDLHGLHERRFRLDGGCRDFLGLDRRLVGDDGLRIVPCDLGRIDDGDLLCERFLRHGDLGHLHLRLCQSVHEVYRDYDVARLTTQMYTSEMIPAMRPTDAYAKFAHGEIDRLPIDSLEGRISAVLLTPYPPGIPLLVPGERVNSKIVEYLRFARDFTRRFPGFESDVHGLVKVKQPDGTIKYMLDCVRED